MPLSRSALIALGNFIRQERERLGWTQTELAGRMGESGGQKSNVSRWEAGEVDEPRLSNLMDLADALGVERWRMIEQLYTLDRPSGAPEDVRRRVERLMSDFPWLVQFFDDLIVLTKEDQRALLTFLEVQKQHGHPVRTPRRVSGRG